MMHAQLRSQKTSKSLAKAKFIWIRQVCSDPDLAHLPCRIAALLLDHINLATGEAWPSQARLAAAAGVTTRAVQIALKNLTRTGHLTVRQVHGRTNRYRPTVKANGCSATDHGNANPVARTDERGFSRLREIPLEAPSGAPTGDERKRLGEEMKALARTLGATTAAVGGANA